MAVQAQYPSNILFLNRNNGQEGQQAAGLVLDQPILYNNNNGSANSRKRTREATVHSNSNVVMNNNNNHNPLIPFESQPPQLIHLSQLHNNVVSTGLRLSNSTIDQQQLLHGSQSSSSSSLLSLFSQGFASQIKQQRDEIEQFLQAQGEELRRALAEKRQRHYRALLTAAEEVVARRLREKEAEVEKATRRGGASKVPGMRAARGFSCGSAVSALMHLYGMRGALPRVPRLPYTQEFNR
ncbi:uncharacterized protein LOC107483904 [Arachis duranensis]|uniref:Uncharacterized protein LOC107483904 n=1 Tax=Arachis duranensis TaxID=130453 RepID=A0A9C6TKF2_ARADU|nr:uncharacterized protein LOC107483904 [Arachis duranensis]